MGSSDSEAKLNVGTTDDEQRVFLTKEQVNKVQGPAMSRETWKAALLALSSLSVLACCFLAQWMAAVSKKSRLKLNKYYQRKKYEKDQLIQYICQEQLNY